MVVVRRIGWVRYAPGIRYRIMILRDPDTTCEVRADVGPSFTFISHCATVCHPPAAISCSTLTFATNVTVFATIASCAVAFSSNTARLAPTGALSVGITWLTLPRCLDPSSWQDASVLCAARAFSPPYASRPRAGPRACNGRTADTLTTTTLTTTITTTITTTTITTSSLTSTTLTTTTIAASS